MLFSHTLDDVQHLLDVLETFYHIMGYLLMWIVQNDGSKRQYNQDTTPLLHQGRTNTSGAMLQIYWY